MMVGTPQRSQLEHKHFGDILDVLGDKGCIRGEQWLKVFPARMYARRKNKTGAVIGVFCCVDLDQANHLWDVIVDPTRRSKAWESDCILARTSGTIQPEVIDNTTSRGRTIKFTPAPDADCKPSWMRLRQRRCLNILSAECQSDDRGKVTRTALYRKHVRCRGGITNSISAKATDQSVARSGHPFRGGDAAFEGQAHTEADGEDLHKHKMDAGVLQDR